jgi:hypothetical protein
VTIAPRKKHRAAYGFAPCEAASGPVLFSLPLCLCVLVGAVGGLIKVLLLTAFQHSVP